MLRFAISENGEILDWLLQRIRVKKGQQIKLDFYFYKDESHSEVHDLTSATKTFAAKKTLIQSSKDIEKDNNSSDWDVSNASNGHLGLILRESDLDEVASYYAEIEFRLDGSDIIYKTPTFILEVVEEVG